MELMAHYPLATLVTHDAQGLAANPLPMLAEIRGEQLFLIGHVARANPVWKTAASHSSCLAIFQGAQAYISPQWYASKAIDGKVVPTWNYQAVHCHGSLTAHDDPVWLKQLLHKLTNTHERSFAQPWSVDDAPNEYVERMLKAIVGIEIAVTRVEAKFKLSQNKSPTEMNNLIHGLQATGDAQKALLGKAMRAVLPDST